ncbi:MAG TPA: hypothetical protein VFD24_05690, partial [Chitinophagaceae bacterium]|nr:hypothetical protein [Chitinophagaceae bacterium]
MSRSLRLLLSVGCVAHLYVPGATQQISLQKYPQSSSTPKGTNNSAALRRKDTNLPAGRQRIAKKIHKNLVLLIVQRNRAIV